MKRLGDWTFTGALSVGRANTSDHALGRSAWASVLLMTFLLVASGANAQNQLIFPAGAEQHEARLMMRMGPQARAWIVQEASREATQPEISEQVAVANVRANFSVLGQLEDTDVEAIAFIVMMEAAKAANEDLKSIMADVKAVNEAKARAREKQTKARAKDAAVSSQTSAASEHSLNRRNDSTPVASRATVTSRPLPKGQLYRQIDTAKNDPDALSELSEMQSLRLQMAMDRRSKMLSALSNLMKKTSETSSNIVKNIK